MPPLPKDEEEELLLKAKAGDEDARDMVLRANLRWVVKRAKRMGHGNVPAEDLAAVGARGLLIAMERDDPAKREGRFISYARGWVDNLMWREYQEYTNTVRMPWHIATSENLSKHRSVDLDVVEPTPSDPEDVGVEMSRQRLLEIIRKHLSGLQYDTLCRYYGLGDHSGFPQDTTGIAADYKVTRQAVWNNISEAIRKLRHPKLRDVLRELLDSEETS